MKKIDKLILDAFIGPFLITFFVVVFILLNINMLKYFDDIIGKGLDGLVLGPIVFLFRHLHRSNGHAIGSASFFIDRLWKSWRTF